MSKSYPYRYITGKVIIKSFGNHTDHSGETDGYGMFEFKLIKPIKVKYFGKSITFDRITFEYGGWDVFNLKSRKGALAYLPLPTEVNRELYEALLAAETGTGRLKDWCFSETLEKAAYPERYDKTGWRNEENNPNE